MARKKRTRKVTKMPRGGYALPPAFGAKPNFAEAVGKFADNKIGQQFGKGTAGELARWAAAKAFDKAAHAVRQAGERRGLFTYNQPTDKDTPTNSVLPGFESTAVRRLTGSNDTYKSKKVVTRIEFGKKPSYAVNLSAKMNGTSKINTFSSDISPASANIKNQLTGSFGFNQKLWWFPTGNHYPSNGDITTLFPGGVNQDQTSRYKIYGMCTKEEITYRIYNSNTYFPIKIKLNLCSNLDADNSIESLQNLVLNANDTVQQIGKIPIRYQFPYPSENGNSANVHPKVSLTNSAAFRENVEINMSKTVKLYPGDVWEVKMTKHNGPGWDLLKSAYTAQEPGISPIEWFPIFEAWGVTCEGVEAASDRKFLGLSPGYLNMEVKKDFTMINQSSALGVQSTIGNPTNFLVRVFKKRDETGELFNVPAQDVTDNSTSTGFYIPVITDKSIDYSAKSTGPQD